MKKATVATLATGLPELPEGQFWRVRYHSDGEIYGNGWRLELHLSAPTRWRPKHTVLIRSSGLHYEPNVIANADLIRETAQQLLDDLAEYKARHRLAGDYPPKRLD